MLAAPSASRRGLAWKPEALKPSLSFRSVSCPLCPNRKLLLTCFKQVTCELCSLFLYPFHFGHKAINPKGLSVELPRMASYCLPSENRHVEFFL